VIKLYIEHCVNMYQN